MAAHDIFRRAVQKGLAILGEPSLLDGTPCGSVHIARNVNLYAGIMDRADDNSMVRADVASIEVQFTPRVDMVLEHPTEGRFELMRLLSDDGHKRQFVVGQLP